MCVFVCVCVDYQLCNKMIDAMRQAMRIASLGTAGVTIVDRAVSSTADGVALCYRPLPHALLLWRALCIDSNDDMRRSLVAKKLEDTRKRKRKTKKKKKFTLVLIELLFKHDKKIFEHAGACRRDDSPRVADYGGAARHRRLRHGVRALLFQGVRRRQTLFVDCVVCVRGFFFDKVFFDDGFFCFA